ncbi:microcin B17 transporter [Sinorhizobium glycinis]|uniref:Microcin B17 transporter n=2 Tax=Sinorhizobium glycinis TaxID=1472378 RepID=A0A178XSB0_9HYPH|nr:peptide antibiotic transporter SbmA [Sinorhizobium glycinis]OAP38131.1 microcin B17 transporter [Sinorhizobium glycinis]
MFQSFFPQPKPFFTSAIIWTIVTIAFWYTVGANLGVSFGAGPMAEGTEPTGAAYFVTPDKLYFYFYFLLCGGLFGGAWRIYDREHRWFNWSVWGSIFIIFSTYFGVLVSLAVNNWRRPFFDLLQAALEHKPGVTAADFYTLLIKFSEIGAIAVFVFVITRFFISHYVFRWRTAMNEFYMSQWSRLRHIEGASQRVQEDTMRFADISEGLGVNLIDAVMTLVAFLPLLLSLSKHVPDLPFLGAVPYSLFWLALTWSIFGTVLLAVVGVKLPGIAFRNQRVEAAYRKELVYGEDDESRATPPTVSDLFSNVRRNYFRMYFHYLYFNMVRSIYNQADSVFVYFFLVPTFVAGTITMGILQQILTAFGQVSSSFQYLVNSWTTIIELLSIHKRLRAFESILYEEPLPEIDQQFIKVGGKEELAL